jgi:hypothetical protein
MKLDETVCRGSLIIHKGQSRVVVGPLRVMQPMQPGEFNFSLINGWKTCRIMDAGGSVDFVVDGNGIAHDEEVDSFFPGVAFELPDYIK